MRREISSREKEEEGMKCWGAFTPKKGVKQRREGERKRRGGTVSKLRRSLFFLPA